MLIHEKGRWRHSTAHTKHHSGISASIKTAIGVAPATTQPAPRDQTFYERHFAQPAFFREDEGTLWKALHLLSIDTYALGGMIETAKSALDPERDLRFYGYQHRIPVSQALGIADPEELSWRTIPALAVDIAASPLTYATYGVGGAAKITLRTGQTIALSAKGQKVLKGLTQAGDVAGEARFLDDLATSPAAQKEYLAFEGIGLRGWGPFFKGRETELISLQRLQALKGMTARAMPETVTSAKIALRVAEAAVKAKEAVYRRVVPFYDVKKLPRPATLRADEMEFTDAFLHYKKSTQWETGKYLRLSQKLTKEAKEAFGPEYKTLVRDYIETPVTRPADLTKAQEDILNTIDALHKSMAEEELARGILTKETEGYLRHALTPEARKYMEAEAKTKAGFALPREYKGTISDINKQFRKEHGVDFNLFVDDPFVALAIRGEEHAKAVKGYDFLESLRLHYGKEIRAADPLPEGFVRTKIDQFVRLPPDVEPDALAKAKRILSRLEPDAVIQTPGAVPPQGMPYTYKEILEFAAEEKLIRKSIADPEGTTAYLAAKGIETETDLSKLRPTTEETARIAILIDSIDKGMPAEQAVERAMNEVRYVTMPADIAKIIDPVYVEASKIAKGYDKAMKFWKWQQTVIHPAYHILNVVGGIFNAAVLGETRLSSFAQSSKLVSQYRRSISSAETFTTPTGKTYTADELIELAGEHGVLGSPGFMDIARTAEDEIALMQKTGFAAKAERFGRSIDPARMARLEEDWVRMAMFFDRVVNKGEEPWTAARYIEKYQFEYHPAGKTKFVKEVAQRAFPFWTFYWNNLLLQSRMLTTQPGKYNAYGKTADAMAEGQELQYWMAGYGLMPAEEKGQVWTYQTPITSLQMFEKLTGFGRLAGTGKPTTLSQTVASMAPLAKIPIELITGRNVFTGQEYKGTDFLGIPIPPKVELIAKNIIGRPVYTTKTLADIAGVDEREPGPYNGLTGAQRATPGDLTATEKSIGLFGGARKYWTQSAIKTEQQLKEDFRKAKQRPSSFTWQQMYEVWKAEGPGSAFSGIPEDLQAGHIRAAEEGGPAEMWNLILQTREENMEWASAQVTRMGLEEKAWKQQMKWEQLDIETKGTVEERIAATKERLAEKGKEINEAIIEKIEYDAQKAKNIKLLNERLAIVRSFLNWLRTKLRREEKLLVDKEKKGQDDKQSKLQINLLKRMIPEYEQKYTLIAGLVAEERAKKFDLPDQIIQAEDYTKALFDRNYKVVRRGKGPALLDETYIKGLVTDKEIAIDKSIIQLEADIVGFPSYIPQKIRDRVKLEPEREGFEGWREEAEGRISELLGKETYDFETARIVLAAYTEEKEKQKMREMLGLPTYPGIQMLPASSPMPQLAVKAQNYTDYWQTTGWWQNITTPPSESGMPATPEEPSWWDKLWGTKEETPQIDVEEAVETDKEAEEEILQEKIDEACKKMLETPEFYEKVAEITAQTLNTAGVEISY